MFDKKATLCLNLFIKDKYFLKKEKVANLLFDLVKYLLTTMGAILLLSEKPLSLNLVAVVILVAVVVFTLAVFITPVKEE
jgi:hypothetical protein